MKGIHPSVNSAATCALLAAFFAGGGCRSTSSGIANPFLAPDRVAPPSTRIIAPGQAQPYYQGDPLPVMQSATAPPVSNLITSNNAAEARSSTGKTLAWNSPGGGTPAVAAMASAATAPASSGLNQPRATPITYGNESPVAVPTDSNALRFALPAPINPEPATPIVVAPTNPQPAQSAAPGPNQGVVLASYTAPIATGLPPVASAPTLNPPPQVTSPWRTPQFSPMSPAPMYGVQPSPYQPVGAQPIMIPAPPANLMVEAPVAMSTNPMAVQLRAVPSPPPQPGDPMPRIRIPGYEVPQTATADGFRPRSSMR